jgi:hypothetical protein
MQNNQRQPGLSCPRCGKDLEYDAGMGLWWCPDPQCGTVVRRVVRDTAGHAPRRAAGEEAPGDEWQPEPRSRFRTGLLLAIALVVIVAVLGTVMTPVLWPKRPVLSLSPQAIEFNDSSGDISLPQAFAIHNDGRGEMHWAASADRAWLHLEPSSGVVTDGVDVVTVQVDAGALAAGSYAAVCTITAEGAYNSPQRVNVLVTLSLSPEARALSDTLGQSAEVYYDEQPPYVEGPLGVSIHLVNNPGAVDVSWDELVEFLLEDDCDESPYVENLRMCGSFAQTLHNNAEAQGIRCAWVSVDFEGEDIGHALNAFMTTDRGLVFIDCTGENASYVSEAGGDPGACDSDKAAYVNVGRKYGLVSLERAQSPAYAFYEEYEAAWDEYASDLDEYNSLVARYNGLAGSHHPSDMREARGLLPELQSRLLELELDQEVLGPCRWNPLGVVERIELYW